MGFFQQLADGNFMPHGQCLLWQTDLLFLHVSGDLLTAFSYLIIPLALMFMVYRREDFVFNWVFLLFAGFIFLCGLTHLINIINIWNGYYYLAGYAKFLTGLVSIVTAVMVWRLIPKAVAFPSNEQLRQKNEQLIAAQQLLEQRSQELEKLSIIDPLTGASNRRVLMKSLQVEIDRFHRQPNDMCVLMIDLDDFKSINDQYGHLIGDLVLKDTVDALKTTCRKIDVIGRYGGEEFAVLLRGTNLKAALWLAERICKVISRQVVKGGQGEAIHYTCSIGVAQYYAEQTREQWLDCADRALYDAKKRGKNNARAAGEWQPVDIAKAEGLPPLFFSLGEF